MIVLLMLFGLAQAQPAFFTSTLPPAELQTKQAVLETSHGTIVLDLLAEAAPTHVAHFITRVREGAYDGTTFHQVIAMGIIQGGFLPTRREPLEDKQRAYVRALQPEFNPTPHDRGILSMARGDDPASATSSFFIVLARTPGLDNQYTVFGRAVEGLDVIEKIEAVPVNGEAPVTRIEVTRVRVVRP